MLRRRSPMARFLCEDWLLKNRCLTFPQSDGAAPSGTCHPPRLTCHPVITQRSRRQSAFAARMVCACLTTHTAFPRLLYLNRKRCPPVFPLKNIMLYLYQKYCNKPAQSRSSLREDTASWKFQEVYAYSLSSIIFGQWSESEQRNGGKCVPLKWVIPAVAKRVKHQKTKMKWHWHIKNAKMLLWLN